MNGAAWHRSLRPRRVLAGIQHRIDSLLKRTRVIFFRCDPMAGGEFLRGELVEADAEKFEQWRRGEAEFPWPAPSEYSHRRGDGHRLFALLVDGRPACYGWITLMRTFWLGELQQSCSLNVSMTWIWDCFTPVSMRNQGHYTAFLRAMRKKFRDRDLLIFCHAQNLPSDSAIRHAGFEPWTLVTRTPSGTKIEVLNPRFGSHVSMQPIPQRA